MGNDIKKDQQASMGSDIMLSNSDSSSGLDAPCQHEPKNPKLTRESSITIDKSSQWDLLDSSAPKLNTDDSSTSSSGETSEESSSDAMLENLKAKVEALTRQANVSELELHTLRFRRMGRGGGGGALDVDGCRRPVNQEAGRRRRPEVAEAVEREE
ncbi:hypothetical protein E3N88_38052 [Mikania micrantha]|uniref:Uncharacterized protein n=1 Tax=Mikania micrantha TaxID=192012 RepID=A0A5N6LTN2_9ASTR|nr:hypothetical protein E3N88_38052 [Mikania micrantha]